MKMHTSFDVCILNITEKVLSGFWLELRRTGCIDADELSSLTFVLKLHESLDQCEQSIVLTATDVVAGFPFRSTLAGENVTAEHMLTTKLLEAEPLSIRVPAVS